MIRRNEMDRWGYALFTLNCRKKRFVIPKFIKHSHYIRVNQLGAYHSRAKQHHKYNVTVTKLQHLILKNWLRILSLHVTITRWITEPERLQSLDHWRLASLIYIPFSYWKSAQLIVSSERKCCSSLWTSTSYCEAGACRTPLLRWWMMLLILDVASRMRLLQWVDRAGGHGCSFKTPPISICQARSTNGVNSLLTDGALLEGEYAIDNIDMHHTRFKEHETSLLKRQRGFLLQEDVLEVMADDDKSALSLESPQ